MFSTISFVHLSHCLSHWKLTLSCWSKRNLAWHRSCHCDKENLVLAFAVGFFPSGVLPQSQFGGSFGNYFGLVSACYATSEALRVHPIERLSSERRPAKGFVMLCYARARCTFFCSLLLASREVQPLACSYAHPTDVGSNTAGDITCQWPRNVVLHRQTTRWNGHRLFKSKSFSPLASSIYFGYLYEDLGREKRPLLCRDCCSGPSSLQRHGTPRKHFFFFFKLPGLNKYATKCIFSERKRLLHYLRHKTQFRQSLGWSMQVNLPFGFSQCAEGSCAAGVFLLHAPSSRWEANEMTLHLMSLWRLPQNSDYS